MDTKCESDLTFKEKAKQELQKIKELSWKKRMEYLWTYYRFLLFVVLAVILVIGTGVTMLKNQRQKPLLSIAIIDANPDKLNAIEQLKEELLPYLGQQDQHEVVLIDAAASSVDTEENMAKLVMVMSVVSDTDVVVCNQEIYDKFSKESIFIEWKELLGNDYKQYEAYMTNGIIDLSRMEKWEQGGYTTYSPAYVCVLKKSKHLEQARDFLDYYALQ